MQVFLRKALVIAVVAAGCAGSRAAEPGTLLLVDANHHPDVRVRWTDADGRAHDHELTCAYTADAGRAAIGGNLECFVASGGVRLTKGAGHPRGAIVRVGFYKRKMMAPLFGRMNPDDVVQIVLSGVRFNQPVVPNPASPVQHLKFMPEAVRKLGLTRDAVDQFNIASDIDTLNARVVPGESARLGALGGGPEAGAVAFSTDDAGLVTMTVTVPYRLFRHLKDPWTPGSGTSFVEPMHFHVEFEALPEGVEPLDIAALQGLDEPDAENPPEDPLEDPGPSSDAPPTPPGPERAAWLSRPARP